MQADEIYSVSRELLAILARRAGGELRFDPEEYSAVAPFRLVGVYEGDTLVLKCLNVEAGQA